MMMTAGVEQCGRSWPLFCSTVRCSAFACSCPSFTPGSVQVRSCDLCGHGWVAHALEKLPPPPSSGPVEVVLPGLVFDLGALVLYRAQAVPVRLKILLDRLFSVLAPDQVSSILHSLGWSLGDYVRGYMLQVLGGKVLDRWVMVTPEEELLLFKQFRRFGETRPIVELMMPHSLDTTKHPSGPEAKCAPKSCQHYLRNHEPALVRLKSTQECSGLLEDNDSSNYFENVPGGLPSLLPFHSQRSELCSSGPSVKERVPFRNLMKVIPEFFPTKPIEKNKPETARLKVHQDLLLHQSKDRSTLKIKTDPDGLRQTQPLWHPNKDHELHLQSGAPGNDGASPFSPFIPSLAPSSSSFSPSIPSSSSSPLQMSQKLQKSPSSPLQPLPSFSSFFCPSSSSSTSTSLHSVPFLSSQLQPLPTSLCSFSPPLSAGGRKGRVHCGVCGKSFYDKGTLKIHYNAVHLKIKHRCTVAGCTMVFSSLRSRNRHSSNPNPRLHTGTHRDAHRDPPIPHGKNTIFQEERLFREGDFRKPSWFCGFDALTTKKAPIRNKLEADTNTHHGASCDPPTNITRPPALMQDTNRVFILNRPQTPPPSPPTAPLDSPPSCFSLGCNGHLGSEDFCCSLTSPACGQPSAGSLPKKKPRKSSMPVKIEREMPARRRLQDEEETPG